MSNAELIAEARRTAANWRHSPHAELIDRLADALEAHEWRPIFPVPRGGQWVMFYGSGCYWVAPYFSKDGPPRYPHSTRIIATHWYPLPAPPGEQK